MSYVPWSKHRMNVWSSLLWEPFSSVIIQIPNGLTAMPQDLCVIQVLTMAHMDHGWPADFQSKGYKQPELPEPPNKINYPTATLQPEAQWLRVSQTLAGASRITGASCFIPPPSRLHSAGRMAHWGPGSYAFACHLVTSGT